jgi:hypothetical protein
MYYAFAFCEIYVVLCIYNGFTYVYVDVFDLYARHVDASNVRDRYEYVSYIVYEMAVQVGNFCTGEAEIQFQQCHPEKSL